MLPTHNFHELTSFINPNATSAANQEISPGFKQAELLQNAFDIPELRTVTDLPRPAHIQEIHREGAVMVHSHSGDGGVRRVVGAIIGHVDGDPEATAQNYSLHAELAPHITYVPEAGGNGNNYQISALGLYAKRPAELAGNPRARIGLGYPLIFSILEGNEIKETGVVTSGAGFGGARIAADRLHYAKPWLDKLHSAVRQGPEGIIAFRGLLSAPAFSLRATLHSREGGHTEEASDVISNITAYEIVDSRNYAKQGKTSVNIDDLRVQTVATPRGMRGLQALAVAGTLRRVMFNAFSDQPIDTEGKRLTLSNVSDVVVPFHVDGERNNGNNSSEGYQLLPGQSIRFERSKIAVPTLMAS